MKVGLIGCGAIGEEIAKTIDKDIPPLKLSIGYDIDKSKMETLFQKLEKKPEIASGIRQVIEKADLIVEAASPKVVGELLSLAFEKGKNLLIMSIGGVLEHLDLLKKIEKEGGCQIFFPSGAIAGLDGLIAAREKEIFSIILTTTKHPKALAGAPYIKEQKIKLENIKQPTLLFEGTSKEAIKAFPRNINVSAILSLACMGMEKTKVKIVADPKITKNEHRIKIKGVFGEMEITVKNVPSPTNPKTSYLAALSAIATLRKMISPVKIGT
ncbi:aspartate dehydrogenase [Candidatus Aerophobetes bacterium]|nr:aspartate dehydrogenase [Candidatus Aerophobetes bacterium]